MAYQGSSIGGDIGSLLRMIQEEKASSVLAQPPASEPSTPVREVVQEPLQSPEAPGSQRVVSTRPEMAEPLAPIAPSTSPDTMPQTETPVSPIAPAGGPIAPTYTPAVNQGGPGPSAPSAPQGTSPVRVTSAASTGPNLGTAIRSSGATKATSSTSNQQPYRTFSGSLGNGTIAPRSSVGAYSNTTKQVGGAPATSGLLLPQLIKGLGATFIQNKTVNDILRGFGVIKSKPQRI
jgi:hypothetical protein